MKNIAGFASGRGTNFNAIAQAIKKGSLKVCLALLVCDNPGAAVLIKARSLGVKVFLVKRKDFMGKKDFEDAIIRELKNNKIDIKYVYITSPYRGELSRMILQTSDNEKAISLLSRFVE